MTSGSQQPLWHPFTQMSSWTADSALMIVRAEGNYLFDSAGNRYLDGVSSLWVNVHGHRRPEIDDAIRQQLDRVAHSTLLGLSNPPAFQLAKQLTEITPKKLTKVYYSDSGSTAVEIALKQAFQYWQHRGQPRKQRFVHLAEAYHGDTLGAVAVGGMDLFHRLFRPLLFETFSVPTPALCRFPEPTTSEQVVEHCIQAADALFTRHAHEIAGVIVEPLIQGAAGMLTHAAGYLRRLADLCKQHEVLLIVDEVATGFGRTGTMFAVEQEGVQPDLMCLAKGISGGYLPLAATLASEEIYASFLGNSNDFKTFYHGHTYTGNPLACAAALASLEVFRADNTLAKVSTKIPLFSELLRERVANQPSVCDVRQCGLMVGVQLNHQDPQFGAKVCTAVRSHGVILRPLGNVVVLMPPLSIEDDQLRELVEATALAIEECQ